MKKKKDCTFHVHIGLRHRENGDKDGPRFCVHADCETHRSSWTGLVDDMDEAVRIGEQFPHTAWGGLALGENAYPIHKDCMIGMIPKERA